MIQTLNRFTTESLFEATAHLLSKLNIEFDRETAEPIDVADLYDAPMPQYLANALQCINRTYFIGVVNDQLLAGAKSEETVGETFRNADRYDGMFVFACDAQPDANLTRSTAAALTRAFNRIAAANPVILIIRQGNLLSLATCERTKYAQEWRQGRGEKIGKVSILRNIECRNDEKHHTHRGHVDILNSLGGKAYDTFEELYKHWMEVFSTELLVKKFYNELSDWYAWAIKVMKFPNALDDSADDQKYNAENGIRLVTRLMFIWFLKEKKLIPNEFFDVKALQKIIKDFDPTQKEFSLFGYMSKSSTYYQAILQNLFFAMLNCPITEDGNQLRGFRKYDEDGKATATGRGDSRLMRYKDYFADSDAFVKLAQKVPFLNGGLFDCLDDPDRKFYLDGFSDSIEVRKALCVPNFLFFGESNDIDLSEWYDDKQKKHLKIRGIIDILNSYRFTIEENTPYEQEVSLDPELLGKVFENLLASYNPETKTTARKSTGSYYTPREIVQYMVNESLVAYLKEQVDESLEQQYRQLLDYNDTEEQLSLSLEQKKSIMSALYHCKVLDPACGSGAFPMGILQQMVHVLSKLDADNTIWKNVIETKLRQELAGTIGHTDEERRELQDDINRNFDLSQNAPDYARKLYLIENCIYGIDIQTIAIQISKLRCFISLVVDQKVNDSPEDNYGIRPLPNLEARFVAANSLIGLRNDLSLANTEAVQKVRAELADANHRIFSAKTLKTKRKWRSKVKDLRDTLVEELQQTGFVTDDDASLIASWDPFNQNCSSPFFDPEWMFGVKKFDIVIGNPPYISVRTKNFDASLKPLYKQNYSLAVGQYDLYTLFIELSNKILNEVGILSFIIPTRMLSNENFMMARNFVMNHFPIIRYVNAEQPFDSASVEANIMVCKKKTKQDFVASYKLNTETKVFDFISNISYSNIQKMPFGIFPFVFKKERLYTFDKLQSFTCRKLSDYVEIVRGFECGYNDFRIGCGEYDLIKAESINAYSISIDNVLKCNPDFTNESKYKTKKLFFNTPKLITKFCSSNIQFALDEIGYCNTNSVYNCSLTALGKKQLKYILGILNSTTTTFWFNTAFVNIDTLFPHIQKNQLEEIRIPALPESEQQPIIALVDSILAAKKANPEADTSVEETLIDILVYLLYNLTFEEVQIVDKEFSIKETEYSLWLANYQSNGTLPTEAEMRKALGK